MADPSNPDRARIKAVSGALMAGKSLLDRSPRPAEIKLPEVARSLDDFARRPNVHATRTPDLEGHSITLDPARVKLPEEALADGSRDAQEPVDEEISPGKTISDRSSGSVHANRGPTPTGRAIPSGSLTLRTAGAKSDPTPLGTGVPSTPFTAARMEGSMERIPGSSDGPGAPTVALPRSSPTASDGAGNEGLQDLGGAGEPPSRPDARSAVGYTGQPDTIGVGEGGLPSGRESADVSAKVAAVSAVGRAQGGQGVKTPESRKTSAMRDALASVAQPVPMADRQSGSSIPGEASNNFVRNPLSTELRDFSLSGPAYPGQGGPASDQSGIGNGSGDPASGGASSPQSGPSGDLSRTNELLQQLIDAVRKQRGSSLPTGGPSVYPDR